MSVTPLSSTGCLTAGRSSRGFSIYHWLSLLLMVTYVQPSSASNWPSVTICTDNGNIDLLCPKGQKLVLADAQYGIKNATTPCPGDGDVVPGACLRDVTVQLQTLCFGNNSCNISLHSASLKNTDPCIAYGEPFLTLNYTCLPDNLLAELACGALFMSRSDLGGLLSSADYPRTFPRRSDICVQTLHLPPDHSLSLSVIDVDLTPGQIVIACGNEVIIGIHHDNIGTCHCQPLRPSQEMHFRGNVTFRLFERSTPSRGVLFKYRVYTPQTFVERAAAVCSTSFTFPGEPENYITLQDYRNITWPNSVKVQGSGIQTMTASTRNPSLTETGIHTTTTYSRNHYPGSSRSTRRTPMTQVTKSQNKVTPTFKTATFSTYDNGNDRNGVLKPTEKVTVIHHYHYHEKTVAIAVGTSVGASLLVILLALCIFTLCRRSKSKPPPSTEMTTTGATPDPLDCNMANDDMEGMDNPTYGILP